MSFATFYDIDGKTVVIASSRVVAIEQCDGRWSDFSSVVLDAGAGNQRVVTVRGTPEKIAVALGGAR